MRPIELLAAKRNGGVSIEARYVDGTPETILVRFLPQSLFRSYAGIPYHIDHLKVELFVGKPAGWSDNLTDESFTQILELGEALNVDRIFFHLRRSVSRLQMHYDMLTVTMPRWRISGYGPS